MNKLLFDENFVELTLDGLNPRIIVNYDGILSLSPEVNVLYSDLVLGNDLLKVARSNSVFDFIKVINNG